MIFGLEERQLLRLPAPVIKSETRHYYEIPHVNTFKFRVDYRKIQLTGIQPHTRTQTRQCGEILGSIRTSAGIIDVAIRD
jgi:hypothetical protein